MTPRPTLVRLAAIAILPLVTLQPAFSWGHDGHMMINRLAAQNLPVEVPAFLHNGEALDLMEYLGPEPDHWNGKLEPELSKTQGTDHFMDLEYADLIAPLPRKRYDFFRALAAAQPQHPDVKLTPENVGTQPYQVEEVFQRLKSAMRDYRKLAAANQNVQPVETVILFYAGWLGHYVGDGSNPLHATYQYNGWNGPNPNGYSTAHTVHAEFESDFVANNVRSADLQPLIAASTPTLMADEWTEYLAYLHHSNSEVEKTYQIEKAGGFLKAGTPDGKAFVDERLAAGAIELRDMIYTAWVRSGDPVPAK
ncbi:S1/P1 nuclease [Granulicella sibirica]|uniref:Nuclease n=1 Tax=Granulicella sibirica TaxID=2479048 RepID=A0A4Q0SZU1_9BACT|nr:S1/P1 nuclease [Granulicella sibirica]RXH55168.1 hypothetical protein GRAN_4272 [Granulicella sibirica]